MSIDKVSSKLKLDKYLVVFKKNLEKLSNDNWPCLSTRCIKKKYLKWKQNDGLKDYNHNSILKNNDQILFFDRIRLILLDILD